MRDPALRRIVRESVLLLGDAVSPGAIAAAVWEGRRYAEELEEFTDSTDATPYLREIQALAPLGSTRNTEVVREGVDL